MVHDEKRVGTGTVITFMALDLNPALSTPSAKHNTFGHGDKCLLNQSRRNTDAILFRYEGAGFPDDFDGRGVE